MSRIRVLEMIDRSFLGGGQAVLLAVARGLDRDAFEPLICARAGGPLEEEARKSGIPFLPAPFEGKLSRGLTAALAAILTREKPDIVHTHGGVAGLYGRRAARRAGVGAVVHTIHGIHYLHYRNPLVRAAHIRLERRLSRRTDAVVLVSEADLRQAQVRQLAPIDKLTLIRNGVDGEALLGADFQARAAAIRDRFDWKPPVVGTVARLHRQKGIVHLLRAAGEILAANPEAHIVVAGGGPREKSLRREARRLGLDRRFLLLGECPEAREILSLFDIFVLPSLWEGLPLVLIEAAVLGKPIVATDIEANAEIVADGETGLLVPPKDPAALAEAVNCLLSEGELAADLGRRARETIKPRFALEAMVQGHADLYRSLKK